jgi:ABC-2 type transport system permease protein
MTPMTTLIRAELFKLRTTRLSYGLLATAAGLTILFSVLEASRAGTKPGGVAPLYTASGLNSVITGGTWALLLAAILGVTVSSGEFRHSTATLTYLATPHRNRVLGAKAIAAAAAGVVFGLVGYVIAAGAGLIFVAAHGYHLAVGGATLARYGAGHMVAAALLAAVGVAVGSLVRSQLAAIIGVFVWTIVIESLLGDLFSSVQPYLPYTAATTLAGSSLGGAAFGPAHDAATTAAALPFAAATGLLIGVAAALSLLAARITVPRDVS